MYLLYRAATYLVSPFVPWFLRRRLAQGKEDSTRLQERWGHASRMRPDAKLVWIHAASIGEATAALPLIDALLAQSPSLQVLLTTVTITSATIMQKRLPVRAIHQYAPVDTPSAVEAFLRHWRPDVALWVDSELWPNLIMQTHRRGTVMGIVNARMSETSYRRWSKARGFIRRLLSCFTFCFAQSEEDAARLTTLGIPVITRIGNLKYDTPDLPCDMEELTRVRSVIGIRFVWLAASTHPREEETIARLHIKLKEQFPELLTIIVPRHAGRGGSIASALRAQDLQVAQRSHGDFIAARTDIYLADTMGELGLFYRLAPVAFIGGSLVPHGGQNPIEAARLGCAMMTGPHTQNFAAIYRALQSDNACLEVKDEEDFAQTLRRLLSDNVYPRQCAQRAMEHSKSHSGMATHIMKELRPYLA